MIKRLPAIRKAGMKPAINSFGIETVWNTPCCSTASAGAGMPRAAMPKMISGMEGGITMPRPPDEAVIAEAITPAHSSASIIAGIISMPTAAVVAGPEPEIAPKNRQAKTVAADMPPVNGPAKLSATLISLRDNPAASIKRPAKDERRQRHQREGPTEVKAIWTNLIGFSPR